VPVKQLLLMENKMEKITKRLIGKEDIAFDVAGNNSSDEYTLPDGGSQSVKRLNASDIPLTKEVRTRFYGAVSVEEALGKAKDELDNFKAFDVLTEDITITFAVEDSVQDIQNKINAQKKNLGSHTLTFIFPAALSQTLATSLLWEGFTDGNLVIESEDPDNNISLYDQANITAIFKIESCSCAVKISHFNFIHQHSAYGINVYASPSVAIYDCQFFGRTKDSYGVMWDVSAGYTQNCTIDDEVALNAVKNVLLDAAKEYALPKAGGTATGDIVFDNSGTVFSNISDDKTRKSAIRGAIPDVPCTVFFRQDNDFTLPFIALYDSMLAIGTGGKDPFTDGGDLIQIYNGMIKFNNNTVESVNLSGSNYIRYSNGLQICWYDKDLTNGGEVDYREYGSYSWTFPKSFISPPAVSVNGVRNQTGESYEKSYLKKVTTTGVDFYVWVAERTHIIAIGKWK
jgi:hypothetical protein